MFKKISNWVNSKMGFDGLLHIVICAILMVVLTKFFSLYWSLVILGCIAVGKEVYDSKHGGASEWKDILCDIIGIIIGGL